METLLPLTTVYCNTCVTNAACLGFFVRRVHSSAQLSESSDVYSFGVFLLELITGSEAAGLLCPESNESFPQWVSFQPHQFSSFILWIQHDCFYQPKLGSH
jgi:hypothetical protein